ncbi:MAG: SAM-dependent methyltransferase [Verrucomicrobiota bacterium]
MIGDFLQNLQRECGGSIPFARFMEAALYHPEFGYYTSRVRTVGRGGDFSTWPELHSSLAQAIATWLRANPTRHIIEVGAGTGQLAAGVLKHLGFLRRIQTTLHIVEISPVLRAAQAQLLTGKNIVWHREMTDALAAADGVANIFSNELPDAFPCRVFVRSDSRWKELALMTDGHSVREILRDTELPESTSLQGSPPDGTRVEVHDSYRRWLGSWADFWKRGELLTVDYGAAQPDLYHRRPLGSLRAYAHHQRLTGTDVYAAFGRRDITADVNFTDLEDWGAKLGWKTVSCCTLSDFISSQCRRIKLNHQMTEAGEAFLVLRQSAGKQQRERGR